KAYSHHPSPQASSGKPLKSEHCARGTFGPLSLDSRAYCAGVGSVSSSPQCVEAGHGVAYSEVVWGFTNEADYSAAIADARERRRIALRQRSILRSMGTSARLKIVPRTTVNANSKKLPRSSGSTASKTAASVQCARN